MKSRNKINFGNIGDLNLDDKDSLDKIYLTLDVDWAHDKILTETIDLLEEYEVKATWFITHQTSIIEKLRSNPLFELGIHPNFNFLLDGDDRNGKNSREVVERLLEIVPEAKSVRSHSLTQNSYLMNLFCEFGLTHESNYLIPYQSRVELRGWKLWNGLFRVPIFWEDDVELMFGLKNNIDMVTNLKGLKVFNFHPIHIFLNSENIDRYQRAKQYVQKPDELINLKNMNLGVRNIFIDLLKKNYIQ